MEELQLIPLVAVGMPIAIVAIVFFTDYRKTQDKNRTLVEVSRTLDAERLDELMKSFQPPKTSSLQMKRGGVSTLFVGVGLFLFGVFFLGHILKGAGALVACIGLGLLAAGFLFPYPEEN